MTEIVKPLDASELERLEKQLQALGRNAFDEVHVAEAAVSLKQGAGRLIRTESDHGLLVVCDPRMRQMGYGRRLQAALPPMGVLTEETEALDWLSLLAGMRQGSGPGDWPGPTRNATTDARPPWPWHP